MRLAKLLHDQLILRLPRRFTRRAFVVLCEKYDVRYIVAKMADETVMEGSLRDQGVFFQAMFSGNYRSPHHVLHQIMRSKPHGTYIDIGANIGVTTVPLAINSQWAFHAFEPDPLNFALLECNLIHNRLHDRIRAYNLALADHPGRLQLKRSPDNFGDCRLVLADDLPDNWDRRDVEVDTLDHVLSTSNLVSPILVKIDVQGAEPLVFEGGKNVLRQADAVALEFWPSGIVKMGGDPLRFFEMLTQTFDHFSVYDAPAAENKKNRIVERIERMIPLQNDDHFDLILSRGPIAVQSR
jgi:FkbM family methyltransferase